MEKSVKKFLVYNDKETGETKDAFLKGCGYVGI